MKKYNMLRIWIVVCIVLFFAIYLLPRAKAEYYTEKYGYIFAERYTDVTEHDMLKPNLEKCRYKVLKYNGHEADVYYVPVQQDCGVLAHFVFTEGQWAFSSWETIWQRRGGSNEDKFLWPCYHYEELHEAGLNAPAIT